MHSSKAEWCVHDVVTQNRIAMGTMFDYVKLTKYLPDGNYDRSHLSYGKQLAIGHKTLSVTFNKRKRMLTVSGSLPYFIQGHNLYFSREDLRKALQVIGDRLGIDVFDAKVAIMEYGVIVNMPFPINDFLDAHLHTRGYYEDIFYNRGKNYHRNDRAYRLKFYLVWANYQNKCNKDIRKSLNQKYKLSDNNFLRYEMHGNPHKMLPINKKVDILAKDLLTDEFERKCRKFLLDKYKGIRKRALIKNTKNDRISSIALILSVLAEICPRYDEKLMRAIDKLGLETQKKAQKKAYFRKIIRSLETETCDCSIENLILSEFEKQPI